MLIHKPYNIFIIFLSLCFWGLFFVPNAYAEKVYGQIEPSPFKIGRFALKYEMDRFGATENFGSNGEATSSLTGDFEAFNVFLGAESDISDKTSLSAGIQYGLSSSSKQGVSRRNGEIKGLQFGYSRVLPYGGKRFKVIADVKYFLSLHDNKFSRDEVSVGDGTSWVQLGSWVGTDEFRYGKVWFFGGINWPFEGLSKNLVFAIRPEFKFESGRLGVGLNGQVPIIDDKDLGEPTERLRFIDEFNAGSLYYQPLNAEFIGLSAWFGFNIAPLSELKVGLANNITGRSAHRGFVLFMALDISFSRSRKGIEFPFVPLGESKSKVRENRGIKRLKDYAEPGG